MNTRFFIALVIVVLFQSAALAAGYDAQKVLDLAILASDASPEDEALWRHYVGQPQPTAADVRAMMAEAAREFAVPAAILEAVGYLENNWIQIGPTIDRGWGIMHLVENDRVDTLGEAARLLNCDRQTLKDDARTNIRGAAALLANFAGKDRRKLVRIEDWFAAAKKLSGLPQEEFQEMQAGEYYKIMKNGVRELNLFNQEVSVQADPTIKMALVEAQMGHYKAWRADSARSRADYPAAIADLSTCNHADGRNHKIDTWVNHWMGEGTYAGAISWFHNPKAEASTQFCIRHTDGEITQVIRVADTSWNCGSKTGTYNNSRSIAVEHEATIAHPEWWKSQVMVQASGKMIRYFTDQYGIPRTQGCPGVTEHKAMQGCSTDCAGTIPWPELWAVINGGKPEAARAAMPTVPAGETEGSVEATSPSPLSNGVILVPAGATPGAAPIVPAGPATPPPAGVLDVPIVGQPDGYTCGPTSLCMALKYYGVSLPIHPDLCNLCNTMTNGTDSTVNIANAAKKAGFPGSYSTSGTIDLLQKVTAGGKPVVVNVCGGVWTGGHYIVVTGVKDGMVYINDPAWGLHNEYHGPGGYKYTLSVNTFASIWKTRDNAAAVISR